MKGFEACRVRTMTDYVLVSKADSHNGNVYHLPSEDNPDKSKCGHEQVQGREFGRKDPDILPNHRLCKNCSGEAKRYSHQGPELGAKLAKMDPEAI